MSLDVYFSGYTSPSNGAPHFSALLFVTTIKRDAACPQDIQCTAEPFCEKMIMEYTHDECCDMLLTLGACYSRAGTGAREVAVHYSGRRHPDANVIRRLQQHLVRQVV
jgi:hypothetical protein